MTRTTILTPLLDATRAVAARRPTRDLGPLRAAIGVAVYFAMLDLVTIAAFALWHGPQRFGVDESWPLVFYFVVSYLGTLLIAAGVIAAGRAGPSLVRRTP
jgi:hypothetical protein